MARGEQQSRQALPDIASAPPPPFLNKTYDMVDDFSTDEIVAWGPGGDSFVVKQPAEFARDLLPRYFKHNNFSSFVRQLNTYGFRKADPDQWEFSNEHFIKDRKDLLRGIHRRKNMHSNAQGHDALLGGNSAIEVGQYGGLAEELEHLKRDKNLLMQELIRLRQQQQRSDQEMVALHDRLQQTEQSQQQVLSVLTQALQNPAFLQQLLSNRQMSQRLLDSDPKGRKKRRAVRPGAQHPDEDADPGSDNGNQLVEYSRSHPSAAANDLLIELLDREPDRHSGSPTAVKTEQQQQRPDSTLEEVADVNSAFNHLRLQHHRQQQGASSATRPASSQAQLQGSSLDYGSRANGDLSVPWPASLPGQSTASGATAPQPDAGAAGPSADFLPRSSYPMPDAPDLQPGRQESADPGGHWEEYLTDMPSDAGSPFLQLPSLSFDEMGKHTDMPA